MGSGKRHICCCDSTTWCDFIKWTYIIFGIVFLMSAILILYRKDEIIASPFASLFSTGATGIISRIQEMARSAARQYDSNSYWSGSYDPNNPINPNSATASSTSKYDALLKKLEEEKSNQIIYAAVKSGISGAFCIAMGVLVWWGTNYKKSIFLLGYIIVQLVLCACSLVSLLGGVIVLDNRSGLYMLTALPATLLALLFVWIVDIQRKEISRDIRPMQQQQQKQPERISSDVESSPADSVEELNSPPVPSNPNKEP